MRHSQDAGADVMPGSIAPADHRLHACDVLKLWRKGGSTELAPAGGPRTRIGCSTWRLREIHSITRMSHQIASPSIGAA